MCVAFWPPCTGLPDLPLTRSGCLLRPSPGFESESISLRCHPRTLRALPLSIHGAQAEVHRRTTLFESPDRSPSRHRECHPRHPCGLLPVARGAVDRREDWHSEGSTGPYPSGLGLLECRCRTLRSCMSVEDCRCSTGSPWVLLQVVL